MNALKFTKNLKHEITRIKKLKNIYKQKKNKLTNKIVILKINKITLKKKYKVFEICKNVNDVFDTILKKNRKTKSKRIAFRIN